jgi:hypothetical protein
MKKYLALAFIPFMASINQLPKPINEIIYEYLGPWPIQNACRNVPKEMYKANRDARKIIDETFVERGKRISSDPELRLSKDTLPEIIESFRNEGFDDNRIARIMTHFNSPAYDTFRKDLFELVRRQYFANTLTFDMHEGGFDLPFSFLIRRCFDDSSLFKNAKDVSKCWSTIQSYYPGSVYNVSRSVNEQIQYQVTKEKIDAIKYSALKFILPHALVCSTLLYADGMFGYTESFIQKYMFSNASKLQIFLGTALATTQLLALYYPLLKGAKLKYKVTHTANSSKYHSYLRRFIFLFEYYTEY